jgi:hypothetical protein
MSIGDLSEYLPVKDPLEINEERVFLFYNRLTRPEEYDYATMSLLLFPAVHIGDPKRRIAFFTELLTHPLDINVLHPKLLTTPLTYAVKYTKTYKDVDDVVDLLLESGAEIHPDTLHAAVLSERNLSALLHILLIDPDDTNVGAMLFERGPKEFDYMNAVEYALSLDEFDSLGAIVKALKKVDVKYLANVLDLALSQKDAAEDSENEDAIASADQALAHIVDFLGRDVSRLFSYYLRKLDIEPVKFLSTTSKIKITEQMVMYVLRTAAGKTINQDDVLQMIEVLYNANAPRFDLTQPAVAGSIAELELLFPGFRSRLSEMIEYSMIRRVFMGAVAREISRRV